jgi:ubiquinone/menaquinone biosynthesis C-methylase UbiE
VVGVDIQADQVARARSLAEQSGVLNASYCTASVYELPFADEAFDAVFANALLIHLRAPERAIDEMRRVVKQGGLVGIRDADRGFDLRLPETPALKEMFELWIRVLRHNGGSPFYARRQRQLLVNAGFQQTSVGAAPVVYGNLEATRRNAQGTRNVFVGLMRTAVQEGWVDQTRVDEICEEIVAWGERPEAFGQTLWFWALGWK